MQDIHADDDWAVRYASLNGHLEVVKYLVSLGGNIRAQNNQAFRRATRNGHVEVVKYLVSLGGNIRADGYTVRLARKKRY